MTPVPKKKMSRSRSNRRKNAASKKFYLPKLVKCSSCGKPKFPHRACKECGSYK